MKKVLFLSLILAAGMTGFAQKNVAVKAGEKTMMKWEQYKALGKEAPVEGLQFTPNGGAPVNAIQGRYENREDYDAIVSQMDLQSNAFVTNRMWRYEDGTIGVVTMIPNNGATRGTGYNYFDGEEFGPQPEATIEGSLRTGWPSYSQYGENGEIVVAHTGSDLVYYTRATKGEGAWVGPTHIPNPELGFPDEDLTWPRVVTSGPNHDIIHVIATSQDEESVSWNFYARSTDGENWVVTTVPTWTDEHFSADSYALASNGNTVVMLYCGSYQDDAFIIKSTDNGETWTRTTIWDNPYSELDWDNDPACIFDGSHTMWCPDNGSVCIDNNGMVHCAFSAAEVSHYQPDDAEEVGTYIYFGWTVDGIFYWNENMGTMQPFEWTCPSDGYVMPADPHNVCRFWYPAEEIDPDAESYSVVRNWNQNVVGYMSYDVSNWTSTMYHGGNSGETDYYSHWLGVSATPAICVDDNGIIAIAFSVVDPNRTENMASTAQYPRSVVVSYVEPPYKVGDAMWDAENPDNNYTDEPGNFYYNVEYLQDVEDPMFGFVHSADEAIWVNGITNAVNREFWFAFQADDQVGLNASSGTQSAPSDNTTWVVKIVPDPAIDDTDEHEAVNPMTAVEVYPNPVVNEMNIRVNASQSSEMNVSIYNIMGQKVMERNVNVHAGINTINAINPSELTSGIYFVTVKANGFENTQKFIVK